MNPTIRPLNRHDVEQFGGLPASVRGVSLVNGDDVLGIAGLLYTSPLQAFSLMKDDAKKYPKMIVKTAKKLGEILDTVESDVFAIADPKYNTSERFLSRIGFEQVNGRLYKWGRKN